MPPHLRPSVGPITSPSSLNARAGSWRTSPTVPTRPPPGSGGGSYGPPSSAGSHTGRGRLNSDVSSRGTGEPTAAPSSNQSLHAVPLAPALGDPGVDPDIMHKTAMAEAAERARRRKQEEEEEREKERERARKKAEEIEAKMKAKEEEEQKKKEAEEEREAKERERKEREEQQRGKDAQRPGLPARPSISDRANSWRTKAAPLPPLPNKPGRAPSAGVNGTTTVRGVPVAIIHEVVALDMNHDDLEVINFADMAALVGVEKDSPSAKEDAIPSAETQPVSSKLPTRPEAPLKSDTVSNWRKAPTVTEPEASPKVADAKLSSTETSPMTSTLPLPSAGPRTFASGSGKSLRPSPLTLVDNHVSRASNVRRTSQEGGHLITIQTPTQPLHSPRTPKTGEFVPYREAPISVLDDTMSRFKEALLQSNPNSAKLDGSMMAAMEEGPNGHSINAAKSPTGLAFSILNRTKPTPAPSVPTPSELRSALSKAVEKVEKTETKTSNEESPQDGTAGITGEEAWTQTQEPLSPSPPGSDVQPTINIPAQSTKKESIPNRRINAAKSNQQWRWDTLTLDPPMPTMSKKTLSVTDVLIPSGGPNKKPVVKVPSGSRPSSPATLLAPSPSADTGKKPKKDQKESMAPAGTPWASKKGGSEEAVWRRGVPVQGPAKKGSAAPKAQEMQTNESASTASTAGSTTASAAPVSMTLHMNLFAHLYIYRRMLCLLRPTHRAPSGEVFTIAHDQREPSPTTPPSASAAKALWSKGTTSDTVPTKNSLKDIADELPPAMPQSVAEVKAEDGESTKKTPPAKFDPYKAFQTVPTQSPHPVPTPPPPVPPSPRRNNSDNVQRQAASPARPRLGPSASAPPMQAPSPLPVRPFPVQGATPMYPAPQVPMTGTPAYAMPAQYGPPVPPSPMMRPGPGPGHGPAPAPQMAGWSPQVANSPAQMMRPSPYGQPPMMNYQPGPPQTPQTQPMFLPSSPAMVPKPVPMPMRQRGLSNSMQAPGTPQQQPQQQMSPYPYMVPIPPTPGMQPIPLHMQGRMPSQQGQPMHPPQPPQGQHPPQAPMQMQMPMGMGMQVPMGLQPPSHQQGSMFPQPPPQPPPHFGRTW
jgi:serine/arginine repetitive matrix protein 2